MFQEFKRSRRLAARVVPCSDVLDSYIKSVLHFSERRKTEHRIVEDLQSRSVEYVCGGRRRAIVFKVKRKEADLDDANDAKHEPPGRCGFLNTGIRRVFARPV